MSVENLLLLLLFVVRNFSTSINVRVRGDMRSPNFGNTIDSSASDEYDIVLRIPNKTQTQNNVPECICNRMIKRVIEFSTLFVAIDVSLKSPLKADRVC